MHTQGGGKNARQSFRDSDDFRHFQTVLRDGFVRQGTTTVRPELMEMTDHLARILQRSDRRESDTNRYFQRFFRHIQSLQGLHDSGTLQAELHLLKARLAYADGQQAISRNFHLIAQESLDSVLQSEETAPQIPGLCQFLEALYAYYYYHTQRDARRRRP